MSDSLGIDFTPVQDLERVLGEVAAGFFRRLGPEGVAFARAIAPVGTSEEGDPHSGAYRDSIKWRIDDREAHQELEIYSDSDHASYLEYGTEHMAPQAPLRRTLAELVSRLHAA